MKRKRRKGKAGDGEREGFKYVGDHWIHASDTAVIVYFAPAFSLPAACVGSTTDTSGKSGPLPRESVSSRREILFRRSSMRNACLRTEMDDDKTENGVE